MRVRAGWLGALVVLGFACGTSQPGNQNTGPSAHTLTVTVSGSGSVKSAPAGIDCGATCSASFAQGASVTLIAAPASGAVFSGWEGACSGAAACNVAMNADAAVTARFAAAPPPGQNFMVTVSTKGSGSVQSSPPAIDCGYTCSGVFSSGTRVTLVAQPDAGWLFSGWSGACSGTSDCSVSADATAAAEFKPNPPPPAPKRTLSVTLQGNGKVTSSPSGIDCGTACSASFVDGGKVDLNAQADTGWQFSGFSGACSGSSCSVTMSGDQAVTATFTAVKPVDECDGLLPGSLPAPVVATLPQNSCIDGTSDDGTGNYLLGYTAGSGPTYPNYLFFTIQDGKAVRIGDTVPGGDESGTYVYSQPSGFSAFHVFGPTGGSNLDSYDHLGKLQSSHTVVTGNFGKFQTSRVAIDPSGGTASLGSYWDDGAQVWTTAYQRFDKTGAIETDRAVLDHASHNGVGIGIALSGHALAMVSQTSTTWQARWLARDGAALTGWFMLESPTGELPVFQFMMDGSLLVGWAPYAPTWKYVVRDGQTAAETLPDWIAQRSKNSLFVVRGGRAYASWGTGGTCSGSLEVLSATSGKPCGCLKVPELIARGQDGYARYSTAGRDGSLIVPRSSVNFGTCQYDLYPQLLKQL